MEANPLHSNCLTCTACGYTTYDDVGSNNHVLQHIEHIAKVRESCQFPKPSEEQIRRWISCFVQPNEIEKIYRIAQIYNTLKESATRTN